MNPNNTILLNYYYSQIWALEENMLLLCDDLLMQKYFMNVSKEDRIAAAEKALGREMDNTAKDNDMRSINNKNVLVIPAIGVIEKRMNIFMDISGGVSTQLLQENIINAVENSSVDAIVLAMESPGGNLDGMKELADTIFNLRGTKPIIAYADGIMASAAYYIGSAADKVTAFDTAQVGSIGVVVVHREFSEAYKEAGIKPTIFRSGPLKFAPNSYEKISSEVAKNTQGIVDHYAEMFYQDVSKYRSENIEKISNEWGTGAVFPARIANEMGLIDNIMTLDQTIEMAADMASGKTSVVVKTNNIDNNQQTLKEDTAMAEKTIEQYKEEVSVLETKVTGLETSKTKLEGDITKLTDSNATLTSANDTLKAENATLTEDNNKKSDDIKAMDKRLSIIETNSTVADEKAVVAEIHDRVLDASAVPENLYPKVMNQLDYNKFKVKDQPFTVGSEGAIAFEAAFQTEVDSWVENLKPSSSGNLGAGHGKQTQTEEHTAPHADENKDILANCGYVKAESE